MVISSRQKVLLAAAVITWFTGGSAFAEDTALKADQTAAAVERTNTYQEGRSQSEMVNLRPAAISSGTGAIDETSAAEQAQSVDVEHASDDASLYLASDDEARVKALEGKTVSAVDVANVPGQVKTALLPLISTKAGDSLTLEGVKKDVSALGGTGVFAQIAPSLTEVPEGVRLSYVTKANPVIHKVEFTGNTVFTNDQLVKMMDLAPDSVLNTTLVNQKLKAIEDLYMKQGYILFSVPGIQVTKEGTLHITIAEGMIEDIKLAGNDKTKDYVILRELRYRKGQPFNKFTASRSMERLYNTGYFEDVNMRLLPGKEDHTVVTEIDVVEQKTGIFSIGAGYSESDGMVGIIELGENNFRGTGDKVNLHWEFGGSSEGKNYQVSYTRPWINDNGDSLGFSLFDRRYDYDDYNSNGDTVASYDKRRKGYNLTWGHASGEYRRNMFTWESVRESYDDYDGFSWGSAGPAPADEAKWKQAIMDNFGRTNSFTFTHVFDNRDNYFNASKGRRLSYSLQYGGHGLGGDYDFYKFTAEGRFYKALGNGHVLALRLMGGYIDGETSYNQLFELGGSDTLRGYEDDQFKGEKMYAATLEYRIPVAKKVEAVLFSDVGSAWSIDEGRIPWYEDDSSINWSVGVGLRLQTPIGPVRLDYGHGDRNKFHFSFGAQF